MGHHVIKFEYERGIKFQKPLTWCNKYIERSEWLFQDAQHAALWRNGMIPVCQDCIKAIIAELSKELD